MNGFALFRHLDIAVLRHEDDDRYVMLSEAPPWFLELWPDGLFAKPFSLRGKSGFLDNFLFDAGQHWHQKDADTLRSGPFMESRENGAEIPLEATAMTADEQRVLILTNLGQEFEDQRNVLQAARENLLTQEQLELEVMRRTSDIRNRELELSTRLIHAAGYRDEETGAHIRRIGLYSVVLARAIGWSGAECTDLEAAAPMHDIGKIGIPDAILKKPGRLTEPEWEIMKQHPTIGGKILGGSEVPMLQIASEIAKGHHENWDGSGYPAGLARKEIPVSARIVAIVDVYDALVHERVYKPAIDDASALEMMRELRGTKFDPGLFDVFMTHLSDIREIRTRVRDE